MKPADILFPHAAQARGMGTCPLCGAIIETDKLRDDASRAELQISGMCQVCQDIWFGTPEDQALINKLPPLADVVGVVMHVRSMCDSEDEHIDITIGWNAETGHWSWQSGDNSFTGGAYGFPLWAVGSVGAGTDAEKLAHDLREDLLELTGE